MVTPMPTAGPFIAAITGFRHLKMRSVTRPPPSRTCVAVVDRAVGQPLHRPAPRVAVERVGAGGEVGAGAEAAAGAGDDDGAHIVVLVGRVEGVDQLLLHRAVEGVELVGPVQRDGEDLIVDLVLDGLIRHGGFLPLFLFDC